MNKIFSNGLTKETIDAILKYENILKRIPSKMQNQLVSFLHEIEQLDIKGFGYRVIDKKGRSAVFSTSNGWAKINQNDEFIKKMQEHMNSEIMFVKKNELKVITRSEDKICSNFLRELSNYGINNSVINYEFDDSQAHLYYYISDSNKPETRDIISHNIEYISKIRAKIQPILSEIFNDENMKKIKIPLLSKNVVKKIWPARSGKSTNNFIGHDGVKIWLTSKEMECFKLIKYGSTCSSIASVMGISEYTAKDHIKTLKDKFFAKDKQELFKISSKVLK